LQYGLKKKLHIILLIPITGLLLFYSVKTTAQSYFFRNYPVESGLSNNTVYCSIQDSSGFLWFGTKDGVNRFDGYHFKVFNMNDDGRTLETNLIGCLMVDKKNTLWVGCQKGLYTFDRHKERMVRFIDSFPEINALQTDKQGTLWFISRLTVCRYNFNTKTIRTFPPAKYFEASSLCLSEEGEIWACTPNGFLQRFDEATETFKSFNLFSHSPKASSYAVIKIYPAGKGAIFAGTTNQGLKRFDIATSDYTDLLTVNPDKTTVYVHDIKKYSDNEFWLATESGIFIFNTSTQKFINLKKKLLDPYSLSDNAVYTLCKDMEGGMWAGTYFGGINYYSKQYAVFQKYFPDNSANAISGSVVREICKDQSGNLWIGTEDAGLNKLNPATGIITQYKPTGESNSIAYTNIHGLLATQNDLWIGTFEHGLDVMDIATGKIKKHYAAGPGSKELKSNFIVCLLQSKAGDIYAGTSNSLFKFDSMANGFDTAANLPSHTFVSCLLEDYNKTIWIGTHDQGIYFYNPVTKQQGHFENEPSNKNSLTNNTINAVYEDSKQNLWLATEGGGLCKLSRDRKTFIHFTIENGLPSNFIFKVLEDNQKNIWVTTSRGLVNLNPENGNVIIYTKDNGLLNDQFNYNSGYKDEEGQLYFGSVKGMIRFVPGNFLKPAIAPPVYITGLQVQNKELDMVSDSLILNKSILYTNDITLPYDRSSISIDFAALSFISPEMTTYSYSMKGIDNEWTTIKPNRKIYFTNLSPGKYIFKVKAGINGNWGKEEKQLTIKILPPWWATVWAYILYAAIAISFAYYLLRTYHIISEDKKEKEIYEAKIDFFTNIAHEIRTPLTLIKGPVENLLEQVDEVPAIKEDVVTMERNTNRLIALITQILDFRQTETKGFSIDFLKVDITALLKENYVNFSPLAKKKKLEYNIELPFAAIHALADEEALHKIFSNLINNAVKYAHSKVTVRLLPADNNATHFTIEVENDGLLIPAEMSEKIFEPFYRMKEAAKQQGTGIGLALAKSLTQLHKGNLYLKPPSGGVNVFVLCLPLKPLEDSNHKNNKRL
jgi:ligand-binding sensor domain-containing protein/signal transduction histidine kinase